VLALGVVETSDAAVREYSSVLDKAVKRGVIKKNTAIRRKKRALAALRKLAK
jgi:ribosomal protein S20